MHMIAAARKLVVVFIAVSFADAAIGLALMPFDLEHALWPLVNYPVLTLYPFEYLGVHVYSESLVLWPPHAGILGVVVYLAIIAIKRVAYKNV